MFGISFFVERFAGLVVYCALIIIFLVIISRCNSLKKFRFYLFLYLLILTLLGFLYIPSDSADVYRWNMFSAEWINKPFHVFLNSDVKHSSEPLAYIYFYLCAFTGIKGALSGITCFIVYFNLFYAFYINFKKYGGNNYINASWILFLLMCGSTFLSVISGIRTALSISIIIACYYTEKVYKRFYLLNIIFNLAACMIHLAALPIIILRYFSLFFGNNRISLSIKVIIIAFVSIISYVFFRQYISDAMNKFIFYMSSETYFSLRAYLSSMIVFLIEIILTIKFFSKSKLRITIDFEHTLFVISFFLFEVFLITNFVMFSRFRIFLRYLLIPIFFKMIDSDKFFKTNFIDYKSFFKIFAFLSLFMSYAFGDLSAYKFFIL